AVERQPVLSRRDRAADLRDAAHDRREGDELGADRLRQDPRERRLAGPGRAPKQQRRQVATRDRPPQRPGIADEMLLPDELLERPRPHARGERLPFGWWLEQGLGASAGDAAGWHVRRAPPQPRRLAFLRGP